GPRPVLWPQVHPGRDRSPRHVGARSRQRLAQPSRHPGPIVATVGPRPACCAPLPGRRARPRPLRHCLPPRHKGLRHDPRRPLRPRGARAPFPRHVSSFPRKLLLTALETYVYSMAAEPPRPPIARLLFALGPLFWTPVTTSSECYLP